MQSLQTGLGHAELMPEQLLLPMQQQIDQLQRELLALEKQEQEVVAQAASDKEAFRSQVIPYTTGLYSKQNEDMQYIQRSQDQQQHELTQQQNAMECQAAQNVQNQQQLQQEYHEAMAGRSSKIKDVWNQLCAKSGIEQVESNALTAALHKTLCARDVIEKDTLHWTRYCDLIDEDIVRLEAEQEALKQLIATLELPVDFGKDPSNQTQTAS